MMESPRDAVIRVRFAKPGESEEDVWRRVAKAWSTTQEEAEAQFKMMKYRLAFPNTPAIANAGNPKSCGSACFVLPINDSLYDGEASITGTLSDASRVHQYGGGTGFSFSAIRPKGAIVSSTGREAPGPVDFLRGYSDWFKRVSQAGLRPAANMAILHVDHPDIEDFISCKETEGDISNFNISVGLSDAFMAGVDGVNAGLWHDITQRAWANGEPGVFFEDTVNMERLHPEEIHATNPCGEVPLLPYEACVLGSIDLSRHVVGGKIDWAMLSDTTHTLTRMLDNIVELQDYPLDVIRTQHHKYRKIGVGVMGYADMLIKLDIYYGSDEAIEVARDVMKFIQAGTYAESEQLAKERGTFAGYEDALRYASDNGMPTPRRRNLCCQVLAPTGTISWLSGDHQNRTSPGIEPNYGARGQNFILGGVYDYEHVLADNKYFVSYDEVTPEQHIRTQAAFQEYTDQAVSKTVNMPNDATVQDVDYIYRLAHASGCKGVTVYREGARAEVVLKPEGAVEAECTDGACAL